MIEVHRNVTRPMRLNHLIPVLATGLGNPLNLNNQIPVRSSSPIKDTERKNFDSVEDTNDIYH